MIVLLITVMTMDVIEKWVFQQDYISPLTLDPGEQTNGKYGKQLIHISSLHCCKPDCYHFPFYSVYQAQSPLPIQQAPLQNNSCTCRATVTPTGYHKYMQPIIFSTMIRWCIHRKICNKRKCISSLDFFSTVLYQSIPVFDLFPLQDKIMQTSRAAVSAMTSCNR